MLEELGVGGVVFLGFTTSEDIVFSSLPKDILRTEWTATLTRAQAREFAQHDLLWSDIEFPADDLDPLSPKVEAAVGLQQFLFTHCGGWSNTFG
jgi:hypothetical protein